MPARADDQEVEVFVRRALGESVRRRSKQYFRLGRTDVLTPTVEFGLGGLGHAGVQLGGGAGNEVARARIRHGLGDRHGAAEVGCPLLGQLRSDSRVIREVDPDQDLRAFPGRGRGLVGHQNRLVAVSDDAGGGGTERGRLALVRRMLAHDDEVHVVAGCSFDDRFPGSTIVQGPADLDAGLPQSFDLGFEGRLVRLDARLDSTQHDVASDARKLRTGGVVLEHVHVRRVKEADRRGKVSAEAQSGVGRVFARGEEVGGAEDVFRNHAATLALSVRSERAVEIEGRVARTLPSKAFRMRRICVAARIRAHSDYAWATAKGRVSTVVNPCTLFLLVSILAGCANADHARSQLLEVHAAEVKQIVQDDRGRHHRGIQRAVSLLSPGFAIEDPVVREAELRKALRYIQDPTHPADRVAIDLTTSPMTFLVAVDAAGVVIARDVRTAEGDRFRGQDWGERFDVVRRALSSATVVRGLGEFPAASGPPSFSVMFAAPVISGASTVGAVVLGIPLRRLAQRIQNQLRLDHGATANLQLWTYFYRGEDLAYIGTDEQVDLVVPDGATRAAGLARSRGGFTGEVSVSGRPFGYLVLPLPTLGDDVGAIVFRSDPT